MSSRSLIFLAAVVFAVLLNWGLTITQAATAQTTTLRDLELEERTLIFFLSDNGGPTRELTSSNAPLAGGKGSLLEGGIRIPFVIQWKGRLPAGRVYRKPVSSLDIVPTALAAAEARIPKDVTLDGVNVLPFLKKPSLEAEPHESLYWRYGVKHALRAGDWKLVRLNAEGPDQLFNLATDIGEQNNLAAAEPARVRGMREAYDRWNDTMAPPIKLGR